MRRVQPGQAPGLPATPARGVAEAPRSRAAHQGRRAATRRAFDLGGAARTLRAASPPRPAVTRPTGRRCDGRRAPAGCRPNKCPPNGLSFCGGPPGSPLSAPAAGHWQDGRRATAAAAGARPGGGACGPLRAALKTYRNIGVHPAALADECGLAPRNRRSDRRAPWAMTCRPGQGVTGTRRASAGFYPGVRGPVAPQIRRVIIRRAASRSAVRRAAGAAAAALNRCASFRGSAHPAAGRSAIRAPRSSSRGPRV